MGSPRVHIINDDDELSSYDATGAVFSYGDNEVTLTSDNDDDELVTGAIFGVTNGPWRVWVKPLEDGPVKDVTVKSLFRYGDVLFRGSRHDTGKRCELKGTIVHATHDANE